MADRFERTGDAVVAGLRCLRGTGEADHQSPSELAAGLATIFRARLAPMERLTIASAAMMALDLDAAEELAEATLRDLCAGSPITPFTTLREEARDWATFASQGELRAYLGAIWGRMPEAEKAGFLSAARPKRRAAA